MRDELCPGRRETPIATWEQPVGLNSAGRVFERRGGDFIPPDTADRLFGTCRECGRPYEVVAGSLSTLRVHNLPDSYRRPNPHAHTHHVPCELCGESFERAPDEIRFTTNADGDVIAVHSWCK